MRKLINLLEASLTPGELAKYQGKYLTILIQLIGTGSPIPVDPSRRGQFGDTVQVDPSMVTQLERALKSPDIASALPKSIKLADGSIMPWGAVFKGSEFKAGKKYNAGHLAEMFMGFSVASKFANVGADISMPAVLAAIKSAQVSLVGKNYRFVFSTTINYPEPTSKVDTLSFISVVNAVSAEAVIEQLKQNSLEPDLSAVLASAVRYANESKGVAIACQRVRADLNNNQIEVISDGSSDAKGTKADLVLKIDGAKVNLLSLKTYSTDTLGQISGMKFESLKTWFDVNFGIDISPYKSLLDSTLDDDTLLDNLLTKIYDVVIYPAVTKMVEEQSPGKEAEIVTRFAHAANFYARGEKLEDVEIVKLDDSIQSGNYKILKFSNNLVDAMRHLDLEVRYVNTGQYGRTIQIWVKPAPGEKVAKGANKLCQFRTQRAGGYTRNYFESGRMLEALTEIVPDVDVVRETRNIPRQKR
jgi:hypothetical protein